MGIGQRWWWIGLAVLVLLGHLWWAPGAQAAIAQPDRVPLTLERLQTQLRQPTQRDGKPLVDLQRFVIDLRPENREFREQFYQLVQAALQKPGPPVTLDLSYSLIQGPFQARSLGLRAPLYGEALSPIFSEAEQAQLKRDRRRLARLSTLSQSLLATPKLLGQESTLQITVVRGGLKLTQTQFADAVDFANTFFLQPLEAQGAQFMQSLDCYQTRFSQTAAFGGALFSGDVRFRSSIFFTKAEFYQTQFRGQALFPSAEFQATANFNGARFQKTADFTRARWQGNADFARATWQADALFSKGLFSKGLFLTDAVFEQVALFRQAEFNQPINLRGASILAQANFSDAAFNTGAYLNVPGLKFDSDQAKIVGDPGEIGRFITLPTIQGNETLLRELVRNFRRQEQIPDANQVDYLRQRLRLRAWQKQVFGLNLNVAATAQLQRVGFAPQQAIAIAQRRTQQPFRNLTDLLSLADVDIATFIEVRDRVITQEPLPPIPALLRRITIGLRCVALGLLLLLSRYGTSVGLVFGVGLVASALFGVIFWLVDRCRRRTPKPILPPTSEVVWVGTGASGLTALGLLFILPNATHPLLTLLSLSAFVLPVPLVLLGRLYSRGRYHLQMTESYFLEEGSLRQLRLLIGRLPNIPRFDFFRDRYMPLQWERRWNWLNYFDFSFNNLLKFGFNDIRLRDQHVPGLVTALVWYQWAVGGLYIAVLFWTLSRAIPGLNLLIYFK